MAAMGVGVVCLADVPTTQPVSKTDESGSVALAADGESVRAGYGFSTVPRTEGAPYSLQGKAPEADELTDGESERAGDGFTPEPRAEGASYSLLGNNPGTDYRSDGESRRAGW
jgi:hypothetical protein